MNKNDTLASFLVKRVKEKKVRYYTDTIIFEETKISVRYDLLIKRKEVKIQ